MVAESLKLAKELENDGISAKVINMHTISPLDKEIIDENITSNLFVTIEEHRVIGGLYSAICEYLMPKKNKPVHIAIGIKENYLNVGDYEYLKEISGLNYKAMYAKIKQTLKEL